MGGMSVETCSFLLQIRIIPIYNSSPPLTRDGRAVYVCLCNRVTDRQLVEAAAEFASEPGSGDSASFSEQVADRLGAGLGCGTCREFALHLVERAATQQISVVLPNRVPAPVGLDTLPPGPLPRPRTETVHSEGCTPKTWGVLLR